MSEHIRYAWGESSLGDFIAAASDRGLVAFEFAGAHAPALKALRERFPDAILDEDEGGLASMTKALAALIEHPERRPELALDMRGSAYEKRVWAALREIPAGRTITYGEIAEKLGAPREAREVAEACAANAIAILIPCHRVVKKDGSLAGYRWGFQRKRALLAREQSAVAFRLG
ncbi:MAG TPA: methylated-DNA--[protein]-cysteine S-methyltransferase [Alphaproteobacteria bacterium]|nr:methylated-DNA--[protein]-cysteine S-methyltransferase [Alphaproteobacteria bacterium]